MKYVGNEITINYNNDYCKVVRLYPHDIADEMIRQDYDHPDGNSCQHDYDCCGHWYAGAVHIFRTTQGGYTQAVQSWSRNV